MNESHRSIRVVPFHCFPATVRFEDREIAIIMLATTMTMISTAWFRHSVVALMALIGWWSGRTAVDGFAPPDPYYHYISDVSVLHHDNYTLSLEERHSKRPLYMNHFTTIGMPIIGKTLEDFVNESAKIIADKKNLCKLSVPASLDNNSERGACYYLLYRSKSGAQLWGTVEDENRFGGFVPHFEGKSRIKMCILQSLPLRFENDDDDGMMMESLLDGKCVATPDEDGNAIAYILEECDEGLEIMKSVVILPGKGTAYSGYGFMDPNTKESFITLEFDCPNFGFIAKSPLPAIVTVQLSAFAREISTFDSVEEYERLKDKASCMRDGNEIDMSFASKCLGTGRFVDENNTGYALIVGHVMETELRTNELTGESFYWVLVETTCGMEVDVVIHPTLLETSSSKPPKVGGVIEGYFWLSGLLLDGNE